MSQTATRSSFDSLLLRPAELVGDEDWTFLVLPRAASEKLPRRGRTSVEGTLNGHPFQATLEPDGQLSHWLKIDNALCVAAGVKVGDVVTLEIASVAAELEPEVPPDFQEALTAAPEAKAVWDATTTIARIDWVHWVESAKQAKTRNSRVEKACDMLASGKARVCCFDPSGFYSKSLSAPQAEE
ncbi:DUF1905 domain-containing protein [Pseudomonas sp. PDM16]|uniref:YdeI/OmpD-associated family protein n=1 Tax=Pseudomonas sp. PDM16 TaxID=2769292 RepID=UPI001786835D|nr:YdeI/OmpD-associated family protein [Pseudomonas sp. PDM16]MBD9416062.1 DUF1905 domain-containing protein [Pseudomonas sp. PDM16]